MDFEPCFKVYSLVSILPESIKLGQMTNLNVISYMVGSVYRLVTIRNSPQFPVEFRNGLLCFSISEFLVCFVVGITGGSTKFLKANLGSGRCKTDTREGNQCH